MVKKYLLDTNVWLRFLLGDVKKQFEKSYKLLEEARDEKIGVCLVGEVLCEIVFVLESFYKVPREKIAKKVGGLVNLAYVEVDDRYVWNRVFEDYAKNNLHLVDLFLLEKIKEEGLELITFDEKLKKRVRG